MTEPEERWGDAREVVAQYVAGYLADATGDRAYPLADHVLEGLTEHGYAIIADPSAGSPEIDGDVARIREALLVDDPETAREELRAAVDAIRADERDRASRRILDYRARYITDSAVAYANGLMRASLLALDVVRDDGPRRLVTLRSDEPVAVPLALLYRADSVCSLVGYRGLDDEARRELRAVSGKIRAITDEAERG